MADEYLISCCKPGQRAEALRLLYAGLTEDQQGGLIHALNAVNEQDASAHAGLLVATLSGNLKAVAWVQILPGRTAAVWPPSPGEPASLPLMQAVSRFLTENDIALAQFLIDPEAPVDRELLEAGQFRKLADLAYLVADCSFFPPQAPASDLEFVPRANDDPQRLGNLLTRTYQDSLDCPALNGVRDESDTLEGYASQGTDTSIHWFFVQNKGKDVGALILAEHDGGKRWELVYMGIVPEARGQGFGWQIVQFALWQAGKGRAQQLVLAVDETNRYALAMYRRAGFIGWDRRTVYARLHPPSAQNPVARASWPEAPNV